MKSRLLIACVMVTAFWVPAPSLPLAAAAGHAESGRVIGTVTLTTANTSRSPATAYDRRTVSPRVRALSESRNVVIFFDDVPAPAGQVRA